MRRRLETNNEVVASTVRGLAENYALGDIFTMDVTTLPYRRSPVANEDSTEGSRVYLTMQQKSSTQLLSGPANGTTWPTFDLASSV